MEELTRQLLLLAENSQVCWSCDSCFLVPGHAHAKVTLGCTHSLATFERVFWPENAEKNALVL